MIPRTQHPGDSGYMASHYRSLERIADDLVARLKPLRFSPPTQYVYNPLIYARRPYRKYLSRYGDGKREVVLFGMNPGPWGMAQTGIPFGEVSLARDWLKVADVVNKPDREHPKRPVLGFDCKRSEVSGRRVWGWARDRFKTPESFFRRFFIANYCPLCFMEESGRNLTPDKLPAAEREPLLEICDASIRRVIEHFQPKLVVGIGKFATARARAALAGLDLQIGEILHPSPASPQANSDWVGQAEAQLAGLGIRLPGSR